MITGEFKCSDSTICSVTSGGADADSAINGTLVTALNPPMLLNAVLKSEPLQF